MKRFTRNRKALATVFAGLVIGALSLVANPGVGVDAADEVNALAGGGEAGIAVEVFSPDTLAVNVGDTVTWTNPYLEPHTVSFITGDGEIEDEMAPQNVEAAAAFDGSETFNSGFFGEDESFSVTFEEGGAYTFICVIHPGMEVTVTVLTSGIPTPAVDLERARENIEEGIALGEAAAAEAEASIPEPQTNPDGTKTWTIPSSPTVPYEGASVDVMRFIPDEVNIGVGDTVTWENFTGVPHTVTFFAGPPPEGFDPFVPVVPSSTFQPGQFINSGFTGVVPAWLGGTEFSLTFDTAGSFDYVCVLHAEQGMAGVVNVGAVAPDRPITPPDTGGAGLLGESAGSWMMLAGLGMLAASFLAAVVVVRRA